MAKRHYVARPPRTENLPDGALTSERSTTRLKTLVAVVVADEDGIEGIVRRDTPYGTQPWITDDPLLARRIHTHLQATFPECYLVRFARVEA